jgi:hypothetical protein
MRGEEGATGALCRPLSEGLSHGRRYATWGGRLSRAAPVRVLKTRELWNTYGEAGAGWCLPRRMDGGEPEDEDRVGIRGQR